MCTYVLICVCTYIYMYMCVYIIMCIYLYIYIYMYTCVSCFVATKPLLHATLAVNIGTLLAGPMDKVIWGG